MFPSKLGQLPTLNPCSGQCHEIPKSYGCVSASVASSGTAAPLVTAILLTCVDGLVFPQVPPTA